MKINTLKIYSDFISDLKVSESSIIEEIENYRKSKEYLLEKIAFYKHYIDNFTNVDYSQIDTLTKPIPDKAIRILTGQIGFDVNTLKRTLNIIVEINKSLTKLEKELNDVRNSIIEKDLFKDIIYKFNNKISDEIVYKGYAWFLGFNMGSIRIKKVLCDKRIKKRIDWGKSNKKKAEILSRGGLPFKVLERNTQGEVILTNEGEHWFEYHTNAVDYLWHWHKKRVNVKNAAYFKFRPTYYNNTINDGKIGNVNKLKHLVTTDSELLKNFFEYGT